MLLQKVAEYKLGDPFDAKTTCGPLISDDQPRKVESYVELRKAEAKLPTGGNRPTAADLSRGFFSEPTVFDEVCWTRDLNTALRFARGVRSGVVWVNSYRDDVVLKHMPMGAGYKQSGIGREWGPEGLDAFLETKAIMVNLF